MNVTSSSSSSSFTLVFSLCLPRRQSISYTVLYRFFHVANTKTSLCLRNTSDLVSPLHKIPMISYSLNPHYRIPRQANKCNTYWLYVMKILCDGELYVMIALCIYCTTSHPTNNISICGLPGPGAGVVSVPKRLLAPPWPARPAVEL